MGTAFEDGHRTLYHWQKFNAERLAETLAENTIHCSRPSEFNDPWDCKPFYSIDIDDERERLAHADWAVGICRRKGGMSEEDMENMRRILMTDGQRAASIIRGITDSVMETINERYRLYCLGPDQQSLLMWSHYADSHRGVCIEFDLRNDVMCCALGCHYRIGFPVLRPYDTSTDAALSVLLSKADCWSYEREYRMVAQERSQAVTGGTLMTDDSLLRVPEGAIASIIVGCQADYRAVEAAVGKARPGLRIRRATRAPDRYALEIEG